MKREDFIKFIPKPENKDIILYDMSLKDLINVNVLEEYNKLYPIFMSKRQEYSNLKQKLEQYQKTIDSVYLYKKSWTEDDYLQALRDDKKTYSIMFGDIKKIENNIKMLQRNLKGINEKIQIQEAKENKKINDKKENIEKDIEKSKESLLNLKNYLDTYKLSLEEIKSKIKENEEEFELLSLMQSDLEEGKCKCQYCGRTIKSVDEDSLIYKKIYNNLQKNKDKLEKLLEQQNKLELNISYYESEIKKVKDNLNNDIQFRKENSNIYLKKNIEILKLEALRDEMLGNISEYEKALKSNERTKGVKFTELKSNIEKYELSLNNLKKIQEMKAEMNNEIQKFNNLKKELKEMLDQINLYLKFINIYFKILEQKANEYCGNDFKFKFFKIEDYKLYEVLEIFYKGIIYEELSEKDKEEAYKILVEKFSIYF